MASLGEGKDPDEFIKMHSEDGAERLAEAFKAAISDTEYRLQMCKNGLDMNVNKDRLTYAVEAVRVLATVENPVEQDLFAAQIAAEVGVGRESILAQVQAAAADPANKTVPEEIKDAKATTSLSAAESEVVAFADVIINEDYRINGVRLVLDEHNRFSVLMPAYLAKDRREWVPYVELKPEIEREMTAFLARNFDFNSEVEVIGGGTAIDVGETKLTLRKAANRNTVKAYAELQNRAWERTQIRTAISNISMRMGLLPHRSAQEFREKLRNNMSLCAEKISRSMKQKLNREVKFCRRFI